LQCMHKQKSSLPRGRNFSTDLKCIDVKLEYFPNPKTDFGNLGGLWKTAQSESI
jgi:hypothetical protein